VLFPIFLLFAQLHASEPFGSFVNSPILVDTQVEATPFNDGVTNTSPLQAGGSLSIQFFVPVAGGQVTRGYNLEILSSEGVPTDWFTIAGKDFNGSDLFQFGNEAVFSALLISGPTVPASGYIGQLTLTARVNIPQGLTLFLRSRDEQADRGTTMSDNTSEGDALDVANAVIMFNDIVPAIPGDLDLDGDVDFTDFISFAGNFGRMGPAPSPGGGETVTVIVRDTVTVTPVVVDTVFITETVTVRDSVEVFIGDDGQAAYFNPSATTQFGRARLFEGFWALSYFDTDVGLVEEEYLMHTIHSDTLTGGEFLVEGLSDFLSLPVFGSYGQALGEYVMVDDTFLLEKTYVFSIEGNRAVGVVFVTLIGFDITTADQFSLTSSSGRISEFSLVATEADRRLQAERYAAAKKPVVNPAIPPDVIKAYRLLKARRQLPSQE